VNKSLTLAANCNDQTVFCLAGNIIDREPQNGGNQLGVNRNISYALNTMDRHAVADFNSRKVGALMARDYKGMGNQDIESGWQFVIGKCKTVRRLTPLECERLQGFPDGYTLIDDKSCSDSARYKALGNGMAQPCADYVIQRIVEVANDRD
jgi:DNA (cytosine-5)-methyltransferase 1